MLFYYIIIEKTRILYNIIYGLFKKSYDFERIIMNNLTLPYDITCGYFDCSEFQGLDVSPKRTTKKFEIEYYLSDESSTFADDKEYPVRNNFIRIATPNQTVYSHLPFYTIYLKFSADGVLAEKLNKVPKYFRCIDFHKMKKLLEELIKLQDDEKQILLFNSKMLEVLQQILNEAQFSKTPKNINVDVVLKAKAFVDENFSKPITLKDVADKVALSPNHFHTVFKTTYKITPHDYLIEKRISAAKDMLWHTQNPIDLIAEKCGFGCQQYFTDVFKKRLGTTPARYRKTLQQNYFE